MTKAEFIELIKEKGGFESKAAAERATNAFLESITEVLKKGDSIAFVGFGTFSVVDVPEKSGKVPGSNKTYFKPAHKAPKFKAGKYLKEAVASGK
ncbi:MAG: HU family DNA-binding protein [Epsilonproteobacteria bacterium]|nr:HU family DNA-binding protein [Campylobacterota bacterium]